MFDSTVELITLATSNSLFIFCVCNLIIAILLAGGSKLPTSEFDQESAIPISTEFNYIGEAISSCSSEKNVKLTGIVEDSNVNNTVVDVDEVNGDEEDDELRKRIEEFIDKINRSWKAEKLRTCQLVPPHILYMQSE